LRKILTALISVALIGPSVIAAAATPAHAATCALPAWEIIGVRGSGELVGDDPTGMGLPIGKAERSARAWLTAHRVASSQIGDYYVHYPAIAVSDLNFVNLTSGAYADSVRQGTVDLAHRIEADVANCPNTKFILMGYSQGAHVIHQYLDQAPTAVLQAIDGMLLVADPTGWVGTYSHGIDPSTGADRGMESIGGSLMHDGLSTLIIPRTITICFTNDGVCANPYVPLSGDADKYLALHTSAHFTYHLCCSPVDVMDYWGKQVTRVAFGLSLAQSAANGSVNDQTNTTRMFVRGSDNLDHEKYLPSGSSTWHAFTAGVAPTGTTVASDPTAVVDQKGVIRVFIRGADRKLYVRTHTSSGWSSWLSLGGVINGRPGVVVDSLNVVRVYVRTSNDTVDEISLQNGSSTWSAYLSLGLITTVDPVPIVDDQDIVRVYAVDTNSDLVERSLPANGNWSLWANLGFGPFIGAPVPVVDTAGTVRVYIRQQAHLLVEKSLPVGGTWSPIWIASYLPPGNPYILYTTADPVAYVDHYGTIRIYAQDEYGGAFRERYLGRTDGGTWSDTWNALGSNIKAPIGAVNDIYSGLYVFTHDSSNTMSIDTLPLNGTWSGLKPQTELILAS
jgi:hypothetical protein